jgi:hypothetical protein
VLPHISNYQDYHIDRILAMCQKHHIHDASAYLLERTGDVQAALALTLTTIDAHVATLR